ncbi:MAG: nucleotidyl transferase AbiEii/AbiGii toxin family protein [bacterium]|nr:nucleotidyl transferase AbiEii/AbiGii toxin family protein [bacterium]
MRNVLKEEIQNFILQYIYNHAQYKELIFTGGTCLRKVYGLQRLSEDLDFDYTTPLIIENFADNIRNYFISTLQYKDIETKISNNKSTVFIKFPFLLKDLNLVENRGETSLLFVRCDFSKESIGIFKTEVNSLSTADSSFFLKNYDLSTLFANKIIAFLTREFFKGSDQTIAFKGRDVFDIVWFIERSKRDNFQLKPNWQRVTKLFPDKSSQEIMTAVVEKTQKIESSKVYQDLAPFIESEQSIRMFCDNFATIIKQEAHYLAQ